MLCTPLFPFLYTHEENFCNTHTQIQQKHNISWHCKKMKLHFSPNWIVAASARLQIEQYTTIRLHYTYTFCWSLGQESFRTKLIKVLKVSRLLLQYAMASCNIYDKSTIRIGESLIKRNGFILSGVIQTYKVGVFNC